jgi:hypothetical protein
MNGIMAIETFPHYHLRDWQEVPGVEEMLDGGRVSREKAVEIHKTRVDLLNSCAFETYKLYAKYVSLGVKRLKVHLSIKG